MGCLYAVGKNPKVVSGHLVGCLYAVVKLQ